VGWSDGHEADPPGSGIACRGTVCMQRGLLSLWMVRLTGFDPDVTEALDATGTCFSSRRVRMPERRCAIAVLY